MNDPISIAVVGVGAWGKNLARNFHQIPDASLRYLCDVHGARLGEQAQLYPGVKPTRDFAEVLDDPEVDAVVIATVAPTHYDLCRRSLEAGKDVFVEKPFVLKVAEAEQLIAMAHRDQRILMVGHLLEYHPVVTRLREMINSGALGDIHYVYSQRLNLGTVRGDENALWSFAPHDVSSILYLLGEEPTDVSARGQSYLRSGIADVVFMTLNFEDRAMAHIHVSWLDPHKSRKLTVVGSEKMAVFDDMEASEKLRIYDKGADRDSDYRSFAEYVSLRFGDVTIPHIKVGEPLRLECEHFLDCVRNRHQPRSDGHDGLRVLKILDAGQRSLENNGTPVTISPARARQGGND